MIREKLDNNYFVFLFMTMVLTLVVAGFFFKYEMYRKDIEINKLNAQIENLESEVKSEEKANHTLSRELVRVANRRNNQLITNELLNLVIGNNKMLLLMRDEILEYNNKVEEANYQAFLIYTLSKENNIDPLLMLSVARKENKLRHIVNEKVTVNGKSAKGMFQITPIVESIYDKNALVFEENVYIAVKFFKSLLDRYRDVELVLAHYNAGSKAREALYSYPETIDYVDSVIYYYNSYLKELENGE